MATLQIRKKSAKVWAHVISDGDTFILSKMYCKTDGDTFRIVEDGGSNRKEYDYSNITVYDDTDASTPETFLNSQALMLRLSALGYVGFSQDGEVVIADLISTDASNSIELGTDGKLFSSGGGGGGVTEVANFASLPTTGETGVIYVTTDNNKLYRWSGSTYVEISSSSIPNIDQVITAGNTTTQDVKTGALEVTLTGSSKNFVVKSGGTELAKVNLSGDITAKRDIYGSVAYLSRFNTPVGSDGFTSNALANYIKPLTDNWEVKTQMKYLADYSASFTDRSLVDKAYVDSVVVSGSGDMTKAVYDTDDDGIVDSSKKEMVAFINKSGATITKGTIVYLKSSSSSASYPEVLKANASTEATSSKTIGAVYEDVANDATGYVVTSGEVSNLDTSAYSIGDKLWLSTTDGLVTTTAPTQPNHAVFIGTVTRSQSTNGRILYAIQNGYELNELHNVSDTSYSTPIDTDSLLIKDVTNSLWKRLTWANLKSNLDSVYLRYNQASHFVINDVTDSSAVTGTTAETIAKSYTIDANSFTHSYVPKLFLYAQKTNTNGAFTIREYMSNTNNFATAINTAIYTTTGGTVRGVPIERMFRKFVGTNLYTQLSVQSTLSDNIVTANAGTTLAINQANTIYVWYTLQNASTGDSTVITMVNLID